MSAHGRRSSKTNGIDARVGLESGLDSEAGDEANEWPEDKGPGKSVTESGFGSWILARVRARQQGIPSETTVKGR